MGGSLKRWCPILVMAALVGVCTHGMDGRGSDGPDLQRRRAAAEGGEVPSGDAECSPIGTNLAMPAYWTASHPFVDAMKPTFEFTSGGPDAWDDGREVEVDEHGWPRRLRPGQIARVFIFEDEQRHPTGRFTVLYRGTGHIDYHGGVRNLKRSDGRDTFDLERGGLFLNITHVDPEDPIRDIRVLLPGGRCASDPFEHCRSDGDCDDRCVPFEENYESHPFHPRFLSELRPFRALRFMDWMLTNREVGLVDGEQEPEPIGEMEDYPEREDRSWRPVPVDVMVDLANLLGQDAWFNMPHQASDDFVRRFAERVAERLRPELRVYVEYSNEVWNTIFDQHHWVNARGCRAYAASPSDACDGDGDGELCEHDLTGPARERCERYGRRWFGQRTVEVGRIWREAFGERAGRVVRVMGTQVDGSWWYEDVLRQRVDDRPVHQQIDAVAIAPYFSVSDAEGLDALFERVGQGRDGHSSETFALLAGNGSNPHGGMLDWVAGDARTLGKPKLDHLQLLAYEAGQGLQSHDESLSKIFVAANRDRRMRQVYRQYLDQWTRLSDGGLLMHFSSPSAYSIHGAWGVKEYQGQPRNEAPKYDALLSYIEAHPRCAGPQHE
ncbi:MAG: hypothetical protein ACODAU_01100 [Myxococcota bacterium]